MKKLNKIGNRQGLYIRTPDMCEAIRRARLGKKNSLESRKKQSASLKTIACNPLWRKRVSEGTKKAMRRKDVRVKHLKGLKKARAKHGVNFSVFGRDLVKFEREIAKTLCPLGYIQQHPVIFGSHGRHYRLDFALIKEKIAIECDGPKHRSFEQQEYDKKRDKFLRSLGWRVIRVLHD